MHGTHPEVCPAGCKPDALVKRAGRVGESVRETLRREALDFLRLYHSECGFEASAADARTAAVLASIEATGSYEHTAEELEYGVRPFC